MKASEIREMSVEELELKLADLKEELFNLRFQLAVNQLENSSRIGAVKISDNIKWQTDRVAP